MSGLSIVIRHKDRFRKNRDDDNITATANCGINMRRHFESATASMLRYGRIMAVIGVLWWPAMTRGVDFRAADALLKPYDGPTARERVPADSLYGLVMCGYQGWFNTPGDGGQVGFVHYQDKQGRFDADHCSIDFWPDLAEAEADEKAATALRHPDGSTAYVYSSRDPRIIDRHFRWMQEYGISGVFVQRFVAFDV